MSYLLINYEPKNRLSKAILSDKLENRNPFSKLPFPFGKPKQLLIKLPILIDQILLISFSSGPISQLKEKTGQHPPNKRPTNANPTIRHSGIIPTKITIPKLKA